MRHLKAGRKFGRDTAHRRAMLRALTANLVAHERIETTDAKAKELRRVAERVITRAIRLGPVAWTPLAKLEPSERARRLATARRIGRFLHRFGTVRANGSERSIDLIEKVMLDLAQRFRDRPGGYTRIIKLGPRRGDNAPMSLVEFVEGAKVELPESEKRTAKAEKKAKEVAEAKKAEAAKKAEEQAQAAEAAKAEEAATAEAARAAEPEAAPKTKRGKKAEASEAGGDEPAPKKKPAKKA
jgi:large subunit ribosomal protein L17